jgi:predicted membrane protein
MGLPAVVGVSLGALIGNAYFMAYTGLIDVVFGAVANLVASYIVYRYRARFIPACLAGSLVIGVIVGGYLWIYFPPPPIGGLVMPAWLGMVVSITLSSVIAVTVLGVLLVKALEASGFVETLKGRGL